MPTLNATGANLVVRKDAAKEKTAGGLFIANATQDNAPIIGEVLSVGNQSAQLLTEKKDSVVVDVVVGDKVLFHKMSGIEIDFEGEKLLIVKKEHILGVIRE